MAFETYYIRFARGFCLYPVSQVLSQGGAVSPEVCRGHRQVARPATALPPAVVRLAAPKQAHRTASTLEERCLTLSRCWLIANRN